MKMNYDRLGDVNDVVLVAINYRVGSLGLLKESNTLNDINDA